MAQLLAAYFKEKGYDPKNIYGSVNFDPISKMLQKGKDVSPIIGLASEVVNALAEWPHFRCIGVDALRLNNSGAYIYQELGYALAWGNEYLNRLIDAGVPVNRLIDTGVPVDLAARKIKFNFGISSNYFMEIAKFRAARIPAQRRQRMPDECTCHHFFL